MAFCNFSAVLAACNELPDEMADADLSACLSIVIRFKVILLKEFLYICIQLAGELAVFF